MAAILRSFVFLMALVCIGSFLANSADAQVARGLTRHLGIGYGQGYHKATPLTDPSYYNPYSITNSTYMAGGPGGYTGYSSFGAYSGWSAAQENSTTGSSISASFYPGVRMPKSYIDRPLPKWHGHTRSNIFGM